MLPREVSTIATLERELSSGRSTAAKLTETALARIEALDPRLRAFTRVLRESAAAEAAEADRRRRAGETGPLLGVPIAVKDDFDIAGEPTGRGLPGPHRPARVDDPAVAALRRAGAVIVGKTAMPEGALWLTTTSAAHGATLNPRFPDLSPGGSSGGSAAAVAAGIVPAALGSDMGGSVRIPAACCGLVGLKPEGAADYLTAADRRWRGLRTRGVIANTVADCALLHEAIGGSAVRPPGPSRLRVAVSRAAPFPAGTVDAGVREALADAERALQALGHEVAHADPPFGLSMTFGSGRFIAGAAGETAGIDRARVERRTRDVARAARLLPRARAGARPSHGGGRRLAAFFSEWDLLLCPAIAHRPPEPDAWSRLSGPAALLRGIRLAHSCPVWNITGQPAIALPLPAREDAPASVQLVAARGATGILLRAAGELEAAVADGR